MNPLNHVKVSYTKWMLTYILLKSSLREIQTEIKKKFNFIFRNFINVDYNLSNIFVM